MVVGKGLGIKRGLNTKFATVLGSIVVSILACHARDRGSIPRRGETFLSFLSLFGRHLFLKIVYIVHLP